VRALVVPFLLACAVCAARASEGAPELALPDFAYSVTVGAHIGKSAVCVARDGDTRLPWRLAGLGAVGGFDWAPDGGRFAVALATHPTGRVFTARADPSGGLAPLTRPRMKTESDTRPDWSPDGATVAFTRDVSYGRGVDYRRTGLWLVDVGTRRERQLKQLLPRAFDWSPSGDRLAVISEGDLEVFASDGRRIWTVSRNADGLEDVAWSPTGDLIAARFGHDILLITPERTPVATIALPRNDVESLEYGLGWSPDGQRLAVGGGAIYDRAGHAAGRYAEASTMASVAVEPRWTPDGTVIVFGQAPAELIASKYTRYLVLGPADLYAKPALGGDAELLTSTPELGEGAAVFRPGHAGGTAGTALPCFLHGGPGRDVLRGTEGGDLVIAGAGADLIYGRGGDDLLIAGSGNDVVQAGRGQDEVAGESGNDRLYVRDGQRDRVSGGPGRDVAWVDRRLDWTAGVERVRAGAARR
jgi:Tol biopolymer transport system component